ncbi:TPA: hypothetical protein HA219_00805 [Candidatus Woesearchaeota archaeon]|nr:hypothetical protein [Candidatus Woesearchaeota archaeon]HIH39252.1 hypothetical protein [Candidatus Woesearchaeota archaeon]HIH51123.1 hypothetical protein [Nanoarchaeota archaeon]
MKKNKKHFHKKWEVSIIELSSSEGKRYKVTRSLPELHVSETKMFNSKKEARNKFNEWLS